jgi:hypothetical protein
MLETLCGDLDSARENLSGDFLIEATVAMGTARRLLGSETPHGDLRCLAARFARNKNLGIHRAATEYRNTLHALRHFVDSSSNIAR